ncbi:DNA-binding protein HU-beta [Cruoricaptor ignavus]|uniref:DNA-binding protein HU-beta n=1 Tax=Cruoricaptor ignavus TaxID=1118202 RepID=A0A1M6GX35_9FLAO|nr:HU family DNA-binding protein [Cruoricaptor ignavus]QOR73817.1 integration host factor subunit beta [Cruoricaptor ignavus]SHJ14509.1 DNA-binding protein HU-beta [Cruoricaptor ignavus]
MTKAELVTIISGKLGTEKNETQKIIEAFMQEIRGAMLEGDNVYLRGFGSFIIKTRAAKTGRNISKNTAIDIPAHNIPAFKPAKSFSDKVKAKVPVKK